MQRISNKLRTFMPIIECSWDIPFTAQEESARILFMTEGEGAETLKSVQPYMAKYCAAPLLAPIPFIVLPPPLELARVPSITCAELEASLETPFTKVMNALKPATAPLNPAGIRTVVVRNLPRDIKDAELRALFSTATGLRDLYIPKNTDRSSPYFGTLKGFALVKFHTAAESTQAFLANQKLCIRGKNIALEFAKEDRAF